MRTNSHKYSRRQFMVNGALTLGAATGGAALADRLPLVQASWQPELRHGSENPKDKVLHIIGYSHIDAAWLWPWRDGANVVLTTFRSALDRMKETPDFRYSHSSAIHYQWVERTYPALFAEIKERVREGRLEPVGGWIVEPDCNIPSTESFVRHCLYGKEYFQRALGVDIKIGLNPDSFGHGAGLASIFKGAGYGYYVFMRPQEHEMKLPLMFWWEAPDGSRVLTLRIRRGYSQNADRIPDAALNNFPSGFTHGAYFLGVGDHGGAVTKEQVRQVLELQKDPNLPQLRWSTLKEFFTAIEQSPLLAQLPVIKTELQHHARGCYSAYGEGKQNNRRAEKWLVQAETISVCGQLSHNYDYPRAEYKTAWWKVLFNQFHDIMAGTTLYSDYRDTRDSLGWACETAQQAIVETLESIAKRVDTRGVKEAAVFLFNPLPWARQTYVEFYTDNNPNSDPVPITHLETRDKTKLPLQWRRPDSMGMTPPRLSAYVDLPACGYKVFELVHGTPPEPGPHKDFFTPSDSGFGISSLRAPDGQELLAGSLGLVVISDTSDTWAHGIAKFRQEIGRPQLTSAEVVEDGPVQRVIKHRLRWNNSNIVLEMAQYRGLELVGLRFIIDWHEKEQMLKLELPTAFATPRVFAKVPAAAIERQVNGEEEPYQDWVAVQGKINNEDYCIGLINDSTYSYDCLQGLLRTVLIRSAPFARHDPRTVPHNDNSAWQDQGRQERRFWLVRGKGGVTELQLDRLAEELQTPAEQVIDSAHQGSEPWERSFLEVRPSNVAVLAVKRAEVGGKFIIRLQERAGKSATASVAIPMLGIKSKVELSPWQIKTVSVGASERKVGEVREVSLLET